MRTDILLMLLTIAMGQMCAIVVHAFAWWLRRRALWLLSCMGVLCIVAISGISFLFISLLFGDWNKASAEYNRKSVLVLAGYVCVVLGVIAGVGLLHAWQMRSHWRGRLRIWFAATLSVFGEMCFAALFLLGLSKAFRTHSISENPFRIAFWFTLFILMLFRSLVLKFVRPFVPMLQRVQARSGLGMSSENKEALLL